MNTDTRKPTDAERLLARALASRLGELQSMLCEVAAAERPVSDEFISILKRLDAAAKP